MPVTPETVADARFSGAAITQTMDCSSQLALGIGDQVKGVVKTEQDSQQHAQLYPIQQ